MTTLAPPPATAAPTRRRLAAVLPATDTTPGQLRLLRATLVVLALLLAGFATVTLTLATHGTHATTRSAEPLLVNAETIYSSLADADTTSAQAFLSGGLEPASQTTRYTADIATVGTQLAQAAGRTGQTGTAARSVRTLAAQLPVYTGLIEAARANNRQGLPVGASYLGQASSLLRTTMLPAADQLLTVEQRQLAADYRAARADRWIIGTAAIGALLLIALIGTQLFLTRRTRRLINPGLLAATVVLVVLAGACAAILLLQHHRLTTARRDGSDPVTVAAHARITALIQHGDDSLTLVSRGTSAAFMKDFADARTTLLGDATHPALLPAGSPERALEEDYLAAHARVRSLDDGGRYNAAVALDTSTSPGSAGAAFAALDDALAGNVTAAQARFTAAASRADFGLTPLIGAAPLLALVSCVLSILGIRARLEEYR
ncbi:MAG: hypothetical protein JO144_07665 [Actinobacteria bacterium]|nr:hypothetical protein [Actinomycetota bacterium]